DEVADWTWAEPSALRDDVAAHPHRYTAWFRHLLDPALAAASSRDPSSTPKSGA
ncbi:MAG: isopentenyl-diphosphate Delta-isomerase, partial [Bacteroidetes bacterium SW_8_64_56]